MLSWTGFLTGRWRTLAAVAVLVALMTAVGVVRTDREIVAQPAAAGAPLGADLALVPADAAGFVHIRLADLWKNEMFAGLRKTWERAGEKALSTLDKQFVPSPSSLDRATVFVRLDARSQEPQVFGVIAFSAPFEPAQIVKAYLPNSQKSQSGGKTVYTDKQMGIAATFPDDRHVLIGKPGALEAYLARPVAKDGPLSGAIKLAGTRPVVVAANIAALPIPPGALDGLPEESRPILKAQQLVISLDLGQEARLEVRAAYADATAAGDADKAVRALADRGRKELAKLTKELEDKLFNPMIKTPRPAEDLPEALGAVFGLGSLGQLDDLLANPKLIARDGTDLVFATTIPKELIGSTGAFAAVGVGLLLPAVRTVRSSAARVSSQNNLKQIGLAIHNYHDTFGRFPADITDKTGKPILSWRVAILPFIEQNNLYNGFKMDEPWDSPNNKKFSSAIIKTYLSPNEIAPIAKDGYGLTSYKGVSGPGTVFDPTVKNMTFINITDGTSNTVMVIEAGDPIPWAKPGDFLFDPKKALPKLASPGMVDMFNALMCDGSVRLIDTKKTSEKTLKAAFTRAGGEVLGPDW